MIEFDYAIASGWKPEFGLEEVDESTLLYNYFPGDIFFKIGTIDFSVKWGWIPILEFARTFFLLVNELQNQSYITYDFTESEATINLKRSGESVLVSATYTAEKAEVQYYELREKSKEFAQRVLRDLEGLFPKLSDNPNFKEYRAEFGRMV